MMVVVTAGGRQITGGFFPGIKCDALVSETGVLLLISGVIARDKAGIPGPARAAAPNSPAPGGKPGIRLFCFSLPWPWWRQGARAIKENSPQTPAPAAAAAGARKIGMHREVGNIGFWCPSSEVIGPRGAGKCMALAAGMQQDEPGRISGAGKYGPGKCCRAVGRIKAKPRPAGAAVNAGLLANRLRVTAARKIPAMLP